MTKAPDAQDATAYALATWVFLLRVDGVEPDDAELAGECAAVLAAVDEDTGNAAGERLVKRVASLLGGVEPGDVEAFARSVYGDRVATDLGQGERDARVSRIRKYQFERNRPWMARMWERTDAGQVAPVWLVIERVTDVVTAVDPNPWNDIDETRHISVSDFQVLWELDGCTAVAVA